MKARIFIFMLTITSLVYSHDWWDRNTGTKKDLLSGSAVNDSVVWACGREGALIWSKNGGQLWFDQSASMTGQYDFLNIFAINADKVLVTASPETDPKTHETTTYIFRTTNRGRAWKQVFSQKGTQGNGIFMFDERRGIFYANPINGKWQIWVTQDSGKTWDSTGINLRAGNLTEKSRPNAFNGYQDFRIFRFGTNNSRYYQTEDYGKTWKSVTVPGSGNINALDFSADSGSARQYGLVAGTGLYRTLDSGKTWHDMSSFAMGKGEIVTLIQHDFWEILIARESPAGNPQYSIYQSSNFGENPWDTTFKAYDKNEYTYFADAREGGWLFCFRKGGGLTVGQHKNDQIFTGVDNNPTAIPKEYSLSQNYPNPFNPSTKINYSVTEAGLVTLKVYDVLGSLVSTLINEEKPAGKYSVDFIANNLPSGFYIYEIRAGNFSMTRKMMLVK